MFLNLPTLMIKTINELLLNNFDIREQKTYISTMNMSIKFLYIERKRETVWFDNYQIKPNQTFSIYKIENKQTKPNNMSFVLCWFDISIFSEPTLKVCMKCIFYLLYSTYFISHKNDQICSYSIPYLYYLLDFQYNVTS